MNFLNQDQLSQIVPSAFADSPSTAVSEKYIFLNTHNILDIFGTHLWYPIGGRQARTRKPERQGKQKHLLRLRREEFDFKVGNLIPEILLKNSHDRSCSLDFLLGLFNVVCENGLIIERLRFEALHIRHINVDEAVVAKAIETTMNSFDTIGTDIKNYQTIELSPAKQLDFAKDACNVFQLKKEINPADLLKVHRQEDNNPTLWSVFNVVQENLMKGGIQYKANKRQAKTRKVVNIEKEVIWNTLLWKLLEQYGKAA